MGVHYRPLQFHHPRREINATPDISNTELEIGHLGVGRREMKAEIKDLGNRMDAKFDKMDDKIDRLLYAIIGSFATFLLKGGFDSYLT
ncbi:hypothetical protein FPQ18DRAFT_393050 [Pyronema domesticum]|nr:hypothetical protein FPQ18DRAFT_393050 [Pyronema domesticum]